jgi:hypothetical protein
MKHPGLYKIPMLVVYCLLREIVVMLLDLQLATKVRPR